MRILLTNDDGINAPGIDVLEKIATDLTDDVWVVAPEIDNSGASHSLTLAEPLRMRELGERHFAVKGTPTDCVIMGVRFLLRQQPPDLVLSGVNRGQNLADDITYSGTVAGAIQGTLLGVPSMAMSLVIGTAESEQVGEPIWETPMRHGADLVRKLLKAGWPDGVVAQRQFPGLRARCGQGHVRHGAGPARSRPAAHRGPARYARQGLLLDRHRTPPRQAAARHRSLGGALKSHLGHAALSRLYRPENASQTCQSLGPEAAIDFETVVENRPILFGRL
jgi:broad specificity polyphosphatase/5'/3'-nucleotidase SurE